MSAATDTTPFHPTHHVGKAAALALRLAEAENALHTLTSGQVDAVIDATGKTYLLCPAQEHLRQNENRLQTVLDSVADAITVVGRTGIILSENRSVSRVLGYAPEELVGSVIFKLIHNTDVPAVHAAFIAVLEGFGEQATVRFRHLTREGSYRLVEATMGKLQEASLEALVFALRPTVGHPGRIEFPDAAPPLPVPRGGEPVSVKQSAPEPWRGQSAMQTHLLQDWNDSTTAGQYEVRLQLASTNAHGDVGLVLDIEQSKVAGTRIEVHIDLPVSDPVALADPLELQRAMWSLVKNTIASFNHDSRVPGVIASAADGGLTRALLQDGTHVEPELLPLVFGSLQQGADTMQRLYGSLRFGLFIAKGIADTQRNTIAVSDDVGGQAAPFRLNFKLTSAATA